MASSIEKGFLRISRINQIEWMLDESQLAVGRGWVMRATNGMEQLPGPMGFWVATAHERSDEGSSGERARSNTSRFGNVVLSVR